MVDDSVVVSGAVVPAGSVAIGSVTTDSVPGAASSCPVTSVVEGSGSLGSCAADSGIPAIATPAPMLRITTET